MSSSLNGPLKAISSSGGSLTVLLDCKQFSYLDEANFLFTQLENDPSECGTSKLVFQLSESSPATNVQINHHGGGAASCPAVLITNPQYLSYRGMQLNVSSLQGSMILYGGVDYRPSSNNEIIRFSSYFGMNDVISPMRIPGGVFLVLSTPGSEINLDFQRTDFFSFTSATGGSGAKGLVTSDKFPIPNTDSIYNEFSFNGSGNDSYKYAINVLRYDLGGTGSLTIKSADPNSFFFSDFSKT
uniref:Uncharacterized protein n=1 Tax=Plectus sambesii TaxID=2011161 RepID=A0A914VFL2_9BILA